MTAYQYKNIIDHTLKMLTDEEKENPVIAVNKILNNGGISLLNESPAIIKRMLVGDDYLGWMECNSTEAQTFANNGAATIGVSDSELVIIEPKLDDMEKSGNSNVVTVADIKDDMIFFTRNARTSKSPHGSYLTFECSKAAVCNDGTGDTYNDIYHSTHTKYLDGELNADYHNYIVIPGNHPQANELLGCVGVAIRKNGTYSFGIVADFGPDRPEGCIDEFSVIMICSLGFDTDGANYVNPEEKVVTYIFPEAKKTKSEWENIITSSSSIGALNIEIEKLGKNYYY